MKIVLIQNSDIRIQKKPLEIFFKQAIRVLKKDKRINLEQKKRLTKKEILLVSVNIADIKALNKNFRKKNKPTDILSFDSMDRESLGELVICPQVLKKQARQHGLSFHKETCYMVLHGVLHLLGFDHEQNQIKAKEMFEIQDDLFNKLCLK